MVLRVPRLRLAAFAFLFAFAGCKKELPGAATVREGEGGPVAAAPAANGSGYTHYILSDAHVDPRDMLSTEQKAFSAENFVKTPSAGGFEFSGNTTLFQSWLTQVSARMNAARGTAAGFTLVFNGDPFQRAPFEALTPEQRRQAMANFGDVLRALAAAGGDANKVEIKVDFGDHDLRKTIQTGADGKPLVDSKGKPLAELYNRGTNGIVDPILQQERPLVEALNERGGKPIQLISSDPRLGAVVPLNGGERIYMRHIQYENSPGVDAQARGAEVTPEKFLPTISEPPPASESMSKVVERMRAAGVTGEVLIVTSDSHMPVNAPSTDGQARIVGSGTMSSQAKGAKVPHTIVEIRNGAAQHLILNAQGAMENFDPQRAYVESQPDPAKFMEESRRRVGEFEAKRNNLVADAPVNENDARLERETREARAAAEAPAAKPAVDPAAELEALGNEGLERALVEERTRVAAAVVETRAAINEGIASGRYADREAKEREMKEIEDKMREIERITDRAQEAAIRTRMTELREAMERVKK